MVSPRIKEAKNMPSEENIYYYAGRVREFPRDTVSFFF